LNAARKMEFPSRLLRKETDLSRSSAGSSPLGKQWCEPV
jgi:hypothetical protein